MSLSGSVFHKFVAFGTNEWCREGILYKQRVDGEETGKTGSGSCSLAKLGLSETMSGGK